MKKYEVIYKERGKDKELQSLVVEAESSTEAIKIGREQLGEEYTVRTVKLVREPKESDSDSDEE